MRKRRPPPGAPVGRAITRCAKGMSPVRARSWCGVLRRAFSVTRSCTRLTEPWTNAAISDDQQPDLKLDPFGGTTVRRVEPSHRV
jgi:hypothetical protein